MAAFCAEVYEGGIAATISLVLSQERVCEAEQFFKIGRVRGEWGIEVVVACARQEEHIS